MEITLEMIDTVRERADVGYEEARAALESYNGNIVDAIIFLEKQNKIKLPRETRREAKRRRIHKHLHNSTLIKFMVSKDDGIVLELPLIIIILVTIILPPLTIVGILAALFTGHKIHLERPGTKDMSINKSFDDMSSAASKVTEQIKETINKK